MTSAVSADEFSALMAGIGGFEPRPRLAVAVSGGADSLAVTVLCHDWALARGGSVLALTVDHRLRPESTAEATAVGESLGQRGIAHAVLAWDGVKPAAGLQEAARAARYRLLIDRAAASGILHLVLAHHQDDQAETLLLRLAKGSGADGLAAMAAVRDLPELRMVRPVLTVPKARLTATCVAAGLAWVEDPSNSAPRFARGRLRAVGPALEREGLSAVSLATAAHRLGEVRAALDEATAAVLGRCVALDPAGFARLDVTALAGTAPEIGRRALARCLATIGGRPYPPDRDALERLMAELARGRCPARTLAGCRLVPERNHLLVVREAIAVAAPEPVRAGAWVSWDRRFRLLVDGLARAEGEVRVGALGRAGWCAICDRVGAAARRRLPDPARDSLPALWEGRAVLAVPHLDFRVDESIQVTEIVFAPGFSLAGPSFAVAWAKPSII